MHQAAQESIVALSRPSALAINDPVRQCGGKKVGPRDLPTDQRGGFGLRGQFTQTNPASRIEYLGNSLSAKVGSQLVCLLVVVFSTVREVDPAIAEDPCVA